MRFCFTLDGVRARRHGCSRNAFCVCGRSKESAFCGLDVWEASKVRFASFDLNLDGKRGASLCKRAQLRAGRQLHGTGKRSVKVLRRQTGAHMHIDAACLGVHESWW